MRESCSRSTFLGKAVSSAGAEFIRSNLSCNLVLLRFCHIDYLWFVNCIPSEDEVIASRSCGIDICEFKCLFTWISTTIRVDKYEG